MEYKVDKEAQKLLYIIASGFSLGGVLAIYEVVTGNDYFGKIFILIWIGGVSFAVYYILKQPTKIELINESMELHFKNRFQKRSFKISSLKEIIIDNQVLSFNFGDQKVSMHHQITGLHLLITELINMKPDIKVKGC